MRRMYIHERDDWPSLRWDDGRLHDILGAARFRQGRLVGRLESLGFEVRRDAELTTLSDDVLKSSEIEGEFLDREQVRSSIARRLGMDVGGLQPVDRSVEGIVDVTLDATAGYDLPLTSDRLFDWHAFRKHVPGQERRSVLNASFWDVMSTGLSYYTEEYVESFLEPLRNATYELLDDEQFNAAITYGTNDTKRVKHRFTVTPRIFEDILGAYTA